jgi:hypothetical protein
MKQYRLALLPLLLTAIISLSLLTACGSNETPSASPVLPEDAIAEAVGNYLQEQGAPVDQMEVQIKQIDGDYARVEIISIDPDSPGGFNAFVKRENSDWITIIAGSGMEREHVESLGIPESVWPDSWLIPASLPDASSDGVCPEPATAETLRYTDEDLAYCLLYPASHTVVQLESGNTEFVVGEVMNHIDPRISITSQDLAGRSLGQVVDDFLSGYEGFEIARSDVTLDGQEAVLLDSIPGQDYYRSLFVAHNGLLYQLSVAPYDPNLDNLAQAEQLSALVLASFRFTTP